VRVLKHCNRLPRVAVESLSVQMLKSWWDTVLGSWL